MDLTNADVDVPGGRIGLLNGFGYHGDDEVYGLALVPALESNPPNYATDRAVHAVRVTLGTGQIDVLPLPLNNGIAAGVTFQNDLVLFGCPPRAASASTRTIPRRARRATGPS